MLTPGARLGAYEILSALGAGGMGEVYRARDAKLNRDVALKILPATFIHDPERLARFRREAQVLATLNHPHIGAIYGLDEANGQQFLILELVDGETLADRLKRGALPLDEALAIAKQVAEALEAAHEKGIIHRDLTPSNIALTKDGTVKVLDFGLAKTTEGARSPSIDLANSPTLTSPAMMTGAGVILGTATYMSPEQARGKLVDKRSDIWAFGCVLYEMLTGDRMFKGDDVTEVLAAVVMAEPDLGATPTKVRRLLAKCVEKDPQRRLRDLGDAWELLETGQAVTPSRSRLGRLGWMIAVALGVLAAIGWLRMPFGPSQTASTTLTIVPPADALLRPVGGGLSAPEISPDGSAVMYLANGKLYVRPLDSLMPKLVPGSEAIFNAPFWCADSVTVVFPTAQALMKVRLPDGAPEVIAQRLTPTRGGSCSETGAILISHASSGLEFVAEPPHGGSGENMKPVDARGMPMGLAYDPEFLPGGEEFLFLFSPRDNPDEPAIYLARLHGGKIVDPVLLLKNSTAAHYTPAGGGRILFVRNDNLYAQSLNRTARKLDGEPVLVSQGVASQPGMTVYHADFSVARNGTVAWRPGRAALSQVTVFDRQGHKLGTAGPAASAVSLLLSPDGTRVLATGDRAWLLEAGQTGRMAIPDGAWFGWAHNGSTLLGESPSEHLIELATTSAEVRDLGETKIRGYPNDLSPDGNHVLSSLIGGRGIFATRLRGTPEERASRPVVQPGDDGVFSPRFSPDGRWIVYDDSGGLFVQPFPGPGLRRQIAPAGIMPEWCNGGREIVYLFRERRASPELSVMSVTLRAIGSPRGAPQTLFSGLREPAAANRMSRPLAVSRDCSRIFFPQAVEQPDSNVIHVKAGWIR